MSIKAQDFDYMMEKLGFETRDGKDLFAWFRHGGKKVVRTKRSHVKGRDLPFQHQIRQQMKLNEEELRQVLRCTLGQPEYVELLKRKGIIEEPPKKK